MVISIEFELIAIHTEQTWGMWTRTPPTECGSGCGTAIGTGPVWEKWYKFKGKRENIFKLIRVNLHCADAIFSLDQKVSMKI